MLIPYRAVRELMCRYLTLKSYDGLINDCFQSIENAIKTAYEIEDYQFLNQIVNNRDKNSITHDYFWDYAHNLPYMLKKETDFTLASLAKICWDLSKKIPIEEFEDLVKSYSIYTQSDQSIQLSRFHGFIAQRDRMYKLEYEKIKRNDPCPCGSKKKYKSCHGKNN